MRLYVSVRATDQVGRVLGRRFHGRHARALFGGRGLQKAAVDLKFDVLGEDLVEDLLRTGLVEVIDRRSCGWTSPQVRASGSSRSTRTICEMMDRNSLKTT